MQVLTCGLKALNISSSFEKEILMNEMSYYLDTGAKKPTPELVTEVIEKLNARGFTNREIAAILGVTPDAVTAWKKKSTEDVTKNGGKSKYYLPSKEQYNQMIAILAPKLPGNEFHHRTVFKSLEMSLPDDWEEQMVYNYVYARVPEYQASLAGYCDVTQKHFETCLHKWLRDKLRFVRLLERECEGLQNAISEYNAASEKMKSVREGENKRIENRIWDTYRNEKYYDEHKELSEIFARFELPDADFGKWNLDFPEQELKRIMESTSNYLNYLGYGTSEDAPSTEEAPAILRAEKLFKISSKVLADHKEKEQELLYHHKLIGHVNNSRYQELLEEERDENCNLESIASWSEKLFDQKEVVVYLAEDKQVKVVLREAFEEWILSGTGAEIKLQTEEVNVSGKIIHSVTHSDIVFELIQLTSGYLVLLKSLQTIAGDVTVLVEIPKTEALLEEFSALSLEEKLELKQVLLRQGYAYPGVRAIV